MPRAKKPDPLLPGAALVDTARGVVVRGASDQTVHAQLAACHDLLEAAALDASRGTLHAAYIIGSAGCGIPPEPDSDIDLLVLCHGHSRTFATLPERGWVASPIGAFRRLDILIVDQRAFQTALHMAPYRRIVRHTAIHLSGYAVHRVLPTYRLDRLWSLNALRLLFTGTEVLSEYAIATLSHDWLARRSAIKTVLRAAGEVASARTGVLYVNAVAAGRSALTEFGDAQEHIKHLIAELTTAAAPTECSMPAMRELSREVTKRFRDQFAHIRTLA